VNGSNNPPPVSGTVAIDGWAWTPTGTPKLDVFVDGVDIGSPTYGLPRTDVAHDFPGAPLNVGFIYQWDTTKTNNGMHTVIMMATDPLGRVSTFNTTNVIVSN
jgi:hypothetical protein